MKTLRPAKKLDWVALPFRVVKTIDTHAVELNTPPGIHSVFHTNLVRRAHEDPFPSQVLQNPEPAAIQPDQQDKDHVVGEYMVEKIIGHCRYQNRWEAHVKWVGYTQPTFEPLSNIEDTAALAIYESTTDCP